MARSLFLLLVRGTWLNASWQLKPGEVVKPPVDIEGEFESHVRRQRHEIILIVRSEDGPYDTLGAQSQALHLIAALDDVVLWEKARHLQQADQVEDDDGPPVDVEIEWHLQDKAVLRAYLLVEVACGDSDAVGAITKIQVNVKAEWDTRNWSFGLQVEVSSGQSERSSHRVWVRHLNVVVC